METKEKPKSDFVRKAEKLPPPPKTNGKTELWPSVLDDLPQKKTPPCTNTKEEHNFLFQWEFIW